METYYAAVEDDPLESGGKIVVAKVRDTIVGTDGRRRRLAFLGDEAWCSSCKSMGVIFAAPGSPFDRRGLDRSTGKRQALDGDLVRCQCERHPRVAAVYTRFYAKNFSVHDPYAPGGNATAGPSQSEQLKR